MQKAKTKQRRDNVQHVLCVTRCSSSSGRINLLQSCTSRGTSLNNLSAATTAKA